MATTTPNFGWPVPTSTDLVKDGATAIEALGDGVDASLVDLKGGTTGQILAKATNADMDFTWITNDVGDITAITASSPITGGGTSGDVTIGILSGTTSNLGAVQLSTSTSSTSTTLAATPSAVKAAYDPAFTNNFYAGKNKIINGDFGIWQRGTSGFGLGAAFNADRWAFYRDGSGATEAITQQTFTPGAAPVAGYESQYFWRYAATVAGTGGTERSLYTKIEDVRTFANQTVVLSFWAKADAARTITLSLKQNFGSGGSSEVTTSLTSQSVTTSWARYSVSVALPSISGKTVGTSSYLQLTVGFPINVTETIDLWGFQLEAGSTATPFQTTSGSLQGELALCQRYYVRLTAGSDNYNPLTGIGGAVSTTSIALTLQPPVTMRTAPSSIDYASLSVYGGASGGFGFLSVSSLTLNRATGGMLELSATVSGATAGGFYRLQPNNAAGYVGANAEL